MKRTYSIFGGLALATVAVVAGFAGAPLWAQGGGAPQGAPAGGQGGGRQGGAPGAPGAPVVPAYVAPILQNYTPVTEARLKNPEDNNWLMVRRTYDGWGYSPL